MKVFLLVFVLLKADLNNADTLTLTQSINQFTEVQPTGIGRFFVNNVDICPVFLVFDGSYIVGDADCMGSYDVNNATVRFGDKGTCINAEEGGYNRLKFNFGGRPDMILQKLAHKFAMPILQGNMDTETPHAILIRVNDKKIFKATASFPHTDDYMALSTPSCPDIPTGYRLLQIQVNGKPYAFDLGTPANKQCNFVEYQRLYLSFAHTVPT